MRVVVGNGQVAERRIEREGVCGVHGWSGGEAGADCDGKEDANEQGKYGEVVPLVERCE